jgi:hypothetical protein
MLKHASALLGKDTLICADAPRTSFGSGEARPGKMDKTGRRGGVPPSGSVLTHQEVPVFLLRAFYVDAT